MAGPRPLTYDLVEVVEAQVLSVDLGIVDRCQVAFILQHNVPTKLNQQLQAGQVAMEGSNMKWCHLTGGQGGANVGIS